MWEDIFKLVPDKGGKMARHNNTVASAGNTIRLVLNKRPLPLLIQVELVDEHNGISKSSAGEGLD